MFVHYQTKGFILKKIDRGEADQLFTIYTQDFGKLEILGKAIRKIKSKLRSGVELFYLSEIEFIQGKVHKTLTDAIPAEKFPNLRKDYNPPTASEEPPTSTCGGRVAGGLESPPSAGPLKRLAIAYKISETLDELIKGQEPDEKIWQFLTETFQRLNNYTLEPKTYNLVYYYFLWNLLSILGYQPELYNCSLCQKKLIPEKLYFSPREGGIICQNCFKKIKLGKAINPEIVKILRIILKKDWLTLSKLKIEAKYLKELSLISKSYLSQICEENLLPS